MLFLVLLIFCSVNGQIKVASASPQVLQDRASRLAVEEGSKPCDDACASLALHFPSSVYSAKTGNFEFWDAKQSEITPVCRVEPSSSEEVSTVLKTVIDAKCHFAVKSGGHDRTRGSSNADAGVTIDLVRLNDVSIAEDKKSVKIGTGLRWLDVYTAVEKVGLMVIGGRAADIGVGGLTLGGGISFFSNRYGWACDNVISYNIVLPNTSTQTVTRSTHPNLYRALRGAGASNFGIITSFTLKTFSQPNPAGIWGGPSIFDWARVPELLKLNYQFGTETVDLDLDVTITHAFTYSQAFDIWLAVLNFRHTRHTDPTRWPDAFRPYLELGSVPNSTNIEVKPVSNITIDIAQFSPLGDRNIWGSITLHPSIELEQKIINLFQSHINSIKNITGLRPSIVFQPLSRNMIKQMRKRGGNALGLADQSGPLTIFSVDWKWTYAADDQRNYVTYYAFMADAEAMAQEMGLWNAYKYINYAEATQDVWTGVGEENLKELKRVQRMVDPQGVFAKGGLGGGYFKLNEMPEKANEQYEEEDEGKTPGN